MKLADYRQAYEEHTGRASDVTRKFALAAIGITWLFRIEVSDGVLAVPRGLIWPILLVVLALASDLFQYVWLGGVYAWFVNSEFRKGGTDDLERTAPAWWEVIGYVLFALKIALTLVAYILLLFFLGNAVRVA